MDDQVRKKIFLQAAGCMQNLVGGSGHLACYYLDEATFTITSVRELGGGLTEYGFSAEATLETEFSEYVEAAPPDEPPPADPPAGEPGPDDPLMVEPAAWEMVAADGREKVSATLVLDADLGLALDDQGRVRLGGYTCLPPSFWHPDHQPD